MLETLRHVGTQELMVLFVAALMLLGRLIKLNGPRGPRPPRTHPIPANDGWFLNRRRR